MATKFHSKLLEDLSLMLTNANDYDIIIQVGENQNIKEFRAHSNILRARSSYFERALSPIWITKKDNMIEFKKPNINPTIFEIVLKYMYTSEVDLTNQSSEDILRLLIASDEFLLEELLKHIQVYLIENKPVWVEHNFIHVLYTAFKLHICKELQDDCLEYICDDPQPFITSKEFLLLDKNILYGLLKRDDLQIEEVVAWNYLIKWGIQQIPGLRNKNNDGVKWNHEDYEKLERTLSKFIPLIRFTEISSAEFFDKVYPFKAVIPNHIFEEVTEFYTKNTLPKTIILSPRIGKYYVESKIIKPGPISIITNWINKKDAKAIHNKSDSLYKFNLIYRGSRDRINNRSFNKRCNEQEPILILVKCQNSRKIFGGYTPIGFYDYSSQYDDDYEYSIDDELYLYIYCNDSFIFSFEENDDVQNMKLSRVTSYMNAIHNNYNIGVEYNCNYGFGFGTDLEMRESYGKYKIEEIEAFRVTKI
ncbi:hypothetical protein C1645_742705 [Glomus cerebriforme]|uniref:BTB/POZ domain-containing protein n=1 Tax=Glomus cerebriforme TaxID=658196 RepID=A0A397SCC6_9GLOM|nr:hypothetical protein C1645_742705 [Glomus cerebriforme]